MPGLRRTLARNLADLVRRFKVAGGRSVPREQSLNDLFTSLACRVRPGRSQRAFASQSAQRGELSIILADALAELAADHREVLVLRTLEGRDWEEVARDGPQPKCRPLAVGTGTEEATSSDRGTAMNGVGGQARLSLVFG